MDKIKLAIVGYGNVGKGVHKAIARNPDMELTAVFSRNVVRTSKELKQLGSRLEMTRIRDACSELDRGVVRGNGWVDVAILCGGSAKDLPEQGPSFARYFNTVDSFDTHARIPEYFACMDKAARSKYDTISIISAGWDPGTFSMNRVLAEAFIPGTKPRGFYGLSDKGGLSMGHSDAVRKIDGVQDARQYTHAIPAAIEPLRRGETPNLAPGDMHWRECYVVLKDDSPSERARVTREIQSMPNYFAPYNTEVNFVSQKELTERFSGDPHDGLVLAVGETGQGHRALIEYRNEWASNPEATGSILVACARANYRLQREGKVGAFTMLDIPPAYFSPRSREELLKELM